ncbi:hypothetical protein [Stakelama tenebrarum]|uniref:HEAT repeat domain-containing protein n=1 Tax=Stakelama tenebrarum TaxID=2711215 RepID=A0A6G6Y1X4_9SPHN|nr:hypothetical protein [Sphingosinithalassobacter tenebrarum]QIG78925.1 hypothetical protein G5C33_03400 [Sphingosinithalassobacter tenebrarum]
MRSAIAASRNAAREKIEGWQASDAYRAMAAALDSAPGRDCDAVADAAETLLADSRWVGALLAPLVEALSGDPFFEPPFRTSRDALRTSAILFDCPAATLSGSIVSADAMAAMPPFETVIIPGRMSVTRYVRSGGATLRRWRAEPLTPRFSSATASPCRAMASIDPADGAVLRVDGRTEGVMLAKARRDVVTLSVAIRPGADPLMREYRAADGTLLRVASNDDGASRSEMLLTFLARSGRTDAGDRFAAATHDPAFHTRWSAMREWLRLDAASALPRLREMAAGDANDDVRAAALRTLDAVQCGDAPEATTTKPCRA